MFVTPIGNYHNTVFAEDHVDGMIVDYKVVHETNRDLSYGESSAKIQIFVEFSDGHVASFRCSEKTQIRFQKRTYGRITHTKGFWYKFEPLNGHHKEQ